MPELTTYDYSVSVCELIGRGGSYIQNNRTHVSFRNFNKHLQNTHGTEAFKSDDRTASKVIDS